MNLACGWAGVVLVLGGLVARGAEAPRTLGWEGADLVVVRARLEAGDVVLDPVLAQLRSDADRLLALKPASVLDKTKTAASGDRHDYFSFAPYWWPDPTKPNGLPYIRKDGQTNPESRQGTDRTAFTRTCNAVETLGLAYWFTRDERYAQKAAKLTRVWFLDAATRMNPNLKHAQAIPGINDGRGIGIIESRSLLNLWDGLALVAGSPAWKPADAAAMQAWLTQYLEWLTTSPNGREEAGEENNHGSWYDAQVAGLALIVGRPEEARRVLASVPKNRIARQIEPDGKQPLELGRTKSLSYSLFNLEALVLLARLGREVGLDYWSFATPDGRGLRAALRYVAPFADPDKAWVKEDLEPTDRARIPPLLAEALRYLDDPELRKALASATARADAADRWRLAWAGPK